MRRSEFETRSSTAESVATVRVFFLTPMPQSSPIILQMFLAAALFYLFYFIHSLLKSQSFTMTQVPSSSGTKGRRRGSRRPDDETGHVLPKIVFLEGN